MKHPLGHTLCALAVAFTARADAGQLVIPHAIEDMILVGQEGPSKSAVTRRLLMTGQYIYCSGEPGLQTIDASRADRLTLTDDWPHSSAKMNGAATKDGILYATNWDPGQGLVVFDLADPARPAHLRTLSTALHTWEAEVYGNLLYVSIGAELDSGVNTYDISDPRSPVLIGSFFLGDRLIGNTGRYDSYLYVTHKSWLLIYSAANPAQPRLLGSLSFNALCGRVQVRGPYLYMLARGDGGTTPGDGGLRVFSLSDPAHPQLIAYWPQLEPRDMHFQGDWCIVPASGSGIYTLDVKDPARVVERANWGVSWPDAGHHGGYPICVTGEGNHVFIGTTSGNNPECDSFTCAYYGARVYSVRIAADPPAIAEVAPDPDIVPPGVEYTRSLVLLQGDPPPVWSVVQAPAGTRVDAFGRVTGWTPGPSDLGRILPIMIRATNTIGSDTESWFVRVRSRADLDRDDDVDQGDFGVLQGCLSGLGRAAPEGCQSADLDADGDVDLVDVNLLRSCMGGANLVPDC